MSHPQQSPTKVLLAVSGNLRSSVVAALLKHQGFQVIGLHLKIDESSQADAEAVAKKIGFTLIVEDVSEIVENYVLDHVIHQAIANKQYEPVFIAHQKVLIESLCAKAKEMNCTKIATGHAARVALEPSTGLTRLLRAADSDQDQSYLLFGLNMEQLNQFILPIGDLSASAIERISIELELDLQKLKNPTSGFCYLPPDKIGAALEAKVPDGMKIPGQILTTEGTVLGEHQGLFRYFRGQSKGLPANPDKANPYVVVDMDSTNQSLIVGFEGKLLIKEVTAHRVNWIQKVDPIKATVCEARLGPHQLPAKCKVTHFEHQYVHIGFDEPQKNVVPGQAIVFYAGDEVIGGAFAV